MDADDNIGRMLGVHTPQAGKQRTVIHPIDCRISHQSVIDPELRRIRFRAYVDPARIGSRHGVEWKWRIIFPQVYEFHRELASVFFLQSSFDSAGCGAVSSARI